MLGDQQFTNEQLLQAIREHPNLSIKAWKSLRIRPSPSTIQLRLGGWNKARGMAGVEKLLEIHKPAKIDFDLPEWKAAEQVLIGSLLGDGGVYPYSKNARFQENHKMDHKPYLEWKADFLISFLGGRFWVSDTKFVFSTFCHPFLTSMRKVWYPHGKKIIPLGQLQKLEPLGLAIWYMDDGSYDYEHKFCDISLHGFSSDEIEMVQSWFKSNLGLSARIYSGRLRFVRRGDSLKFLEMIKPFVHWIFAYKLGSLHPSNKQKLVEGSRKNAARSREYYSRNKQKIIDHKREYRRTRYHFDFEFNKKEKERGKMYYRQKWGGVRRDFR